MEYSHLFGLTLNPDLEHVVRIMGITLYSDNDMNHRPSTPGCLNHADRSQWTYIPSEAY